MQYDVKDMLEIAIQNNDSLWEVEVIDRLHGELDRLYSQEAKAEAFDRIVEERDRIGKLMHNKEYPQVFTDEAFWNIDDIINDTESGDSDESTM